MVQQVYATDAATANTAVATAITNWATVLTDINTGLAQLSPNAMSAAKRDMVNTLRLEITQMQVDLVYLTQRSNKCLNIATAADAAS